MTARDAAAIAEACREFLAAHERRAPIADLMTLNEASAVVLLRYALTEERIAA